MIWHSFRNAERQWGLQFKFHNRDDYAVLLGGIMGAEDPIAHSTGLKQFCSMQQSNDKGQHDNEPSRLSCAIFAPCRGHRAEWSTDVWRGKWTVGPFRRRPIRGR